MKKTILLRCLVLVLSLGIMAMSLIGCEGPAGPAGAAGPAGGPGPAGPAGTMNTVPLFMQGTWKYETATSSYSWTFTADRARFESGSAASNLEVIFLAFWFHENDDVSRWDTYPGGYTMEGMQVNGGPTVASDNNHYTSVHFMFNSTLNAFACYNNLGAFIGVFQKQVALPASSQLGK